MSATGMVSSWVLVAALVRGNCNAVFVCPGHVGWPPGNASSPDPSAYCVHVYFVLVLCLLLPSDKSRDATGGAHVISQKWALMENDICF